MSVNNSYPEKQILPYMNGMVQMPAIIIALQGLDYPAEIKRAAYVVIRNETANGKSVVNGTNVCGAQSDSGRWPAQWDAHIVGTCIKNENQTGKLRGFLIFDTLDNGIAFVCDRVKAKGIFIGENVDGKYYKGHVSTPEQEADAYQDEWVHGEDHNTTPTEIKNFVSMYNQATVLFK
jgi:beta-glucanase (GH16 family)